MSLVKTRYILGFFFVGAFFLVACNKVDGIRSADKRTPPLVGVNRNVVVSWTANREAAVNTTGGGYKVHYSQTPNFVVPSTTYVTVPYVSGTAAPTSAVIPNLTTGKTYYFKVIAYSTYTASSDASAQTSLVIP